MMNATGYDWKEAYSALWLGSFGDMWGFADTLADATPLILTGLAFGLCFRAGYFNIGAQGQMIIGALAAVAIGSQLAAPTPVAVFVVVMVRGYRRCALVAARCVLASDARRARSHHDDYVQLDRDVLGRLLGVQRHERSAQRRTHGAGVARRRGCSALVPGADATSALFISVFVAVFFYWLLWHSPWGYEMRVAGLNREALRYAGANPTWSVNMTFVLAGIAAGIAGATQIIGRPPTYALYGDLSNLGELGFDGIAVALIGRNHPIGIIFAAMFFGALSTGARMMQIMAGVPLDLIRIVHGVVIIAMAAPEAVVHHAPVHQLSPSGPRLKGGRMRNGVRKVRREPMLISSLILSALHAMVPITMTATGEILERTCWSGQHRYGRDSPHLGLLRRRRRGSRGPFVGLLVGLLTGALIGLIHGIITIYFRGDQTISGVGINVLGAGLVAFGLVWQWGQAGFHQVPRAAAGSATCLRLRSLSPMVSSWHCCWRFSRTA